LKGVGIQSDDYKRIEKAIQYLEANLNPNRHWRKLQKVFILANIILIVCLSGGQLETKSKGETQGASSSESDRYEELLVNPILIKAASQRGNIDCGGLDYLLVRYGNFFQFVLPVSWGHISVCIEKNSDPIAIGLKVMSLLGNLNNYWIAK